MTEPAPFRFVHEVEVRFRDVDAMGHAHHSLPLVYFEEARAAYWREVVGRPDIASIDYLLAGATLNYHARIRFPERLRVGVRVARIGGKSFDMAYEVRAADGELLSSGVTTQVMYDYARGVSIQVPAEVRRRIGSYEALTAG